MNPKPDKREKPTTPAADVPRPVTTRLRPTVPIGDEPEPIPGGRIWFASGRGPVLATIIAVWPSGVTLRRDDTGTVQFLARGGYTVLEG